MLRNGRVIQAPGESCRVAFDGACATQSTKAARKYVGDCITAAEQKAVREPASFDGCVALRAQRRGKEHRAEQETGVDVVNRRAPVRSRSRRASVAVVALATRDGAGPLPLVAGRAATGRTRSSRRR